MLLLLAVLAGGAAAWYFTGGDLAALPGLLAGWREDWLPGGPGAPSHAGAAWV